MKLFSSSLLLSTAFVLASCGASGAAKPGAKNAAKSPGKPARTEAPAPAALHVRGTAPAAGEQVAAAPGLYFGEQLIADGVRDAKISPDGAIAVWQSGNAVEMYSLKQQKRRVVASNLPSPLAYVEWGNHYFKLKLANTGEFLVDNIE